MRKVYRQLFGVFGVLAFVLLSVVLPVGSGWFAAADESDVVQDAGVELSVEWTGTGQGTGAGTFINSENGYYPADDSPTDNVVASNDTVGYLYRTIIGAGPERTVRVDFELPEYLQFNLSDNSSLCVSTATVTGKWVGTASKPACEYSVTRGTPTNIATQLILVAKDTAGLAIDNQVVTVKTTSSGVTTTTTTSPVTVVSAPQADLVIKPETANSYISSSTLSSSFIIEVNALKRNGYDNTKGASTSTPWTAQLDVSQMPIGTVFTWTDGTFTSTAEDTVIDISKTVGNLTIEYTVPSWTVPGEEESDFEVGTVKAFPVHLIVPKTALSTKDYLNNGDGWEPGQDEPYGFNTYNDRNTGAVKGYLYPNNDWTMARVNRVADVPDEVWNKTIYRPWDTSQTLWEDGNKLFSEGSSVAANSNGSSPKTNEVTEGTEMVVALSANLDKKVVGDVSSVNKLVVGDSWDADEQSPTGVAVFYLPDGTVLDASKYTVQWSLNRYEDEQICDDTLTDGWITSSVAPPGAQSVRVIVNESLTVEDGDNTYTVKIPFSVTDDFTGYTNTTVFRDTMYGTIKIGGVSSVPQKFTSGVIPVFREQLYAGISIKNNKKVLINSNNRSLTTTIIPTVSGLTSSTGTIDGEIEITLDPCIYSFDLTSIYYKVVTPFVPGDCNNNVPGTVVVAPESSEEYNYYKGAAVFSPLAFTTKTSLTAVNDVNISAEWKVTSVEGRTPEELDGVSASAGVSAVVQSFEIVEEFLSASEKQEEADTALEYSAIISMTSMDDETITNYAGETVVVMPGRGDDESYLNNDKLSNYASTEPQDSNIDGTYTVTASIDANNSGAGTAIECTRDVNPSLTPSDNTWSTSCVDNTSNPITAYKVIQTENSGVSKVNFTITPVDNRVNNNYLMWIGPVNYTSGGNAVQSMMAWPVNVNIVESTISGYVYWDATSKGTDRTEDSAPMYENNTGVTVNLLDSDKNVIDTTTADEDGYYIFRGLKSGDYYTQVAAGVPETISSQYYTDKTIDVEQTFSYKNKRVTQASETSTLINLDKGINFENVNYGYTAVDAYADLLKYPSQAECEDGNSECGLNYDITIRAGEESKYGNTDLTDGVLTETASDALYDFNVQFSSPEKAVAITGNGSSSSYYWGVVTESGKVYQRTVGSTEWTGGELPDGEKAVAITGSGYQSSYQYWGVVTETGKVYEKTVTGATWTGGELPDGEKAVAITGSGSYQWGVVTESGKVYQRIVGSTDWTGGELPDGEKAVAITGGGDSPYGYWGVITETGKVYERTVTGATWTGGDFPNGEKAVAITGYGDPSSKYLGVVTESGKVYQRMVGSTDWTGGELPDGEKAVAITGYGDSSYYWGVVTESGALYQREINNNNWSSKVFPDGEKAVAITGGGSSYQYWGVVTESGALYQGVINNDNWTGGELPDGEKAVAITGNGGNSSNYWGVVTESGKVYQRTAGGTDWTGGELPNGEKAVTITGNGDSSDYWGVVTENGKVYERAVTGATWTGGDLPDGEKAVAITGSGYWGVVTESGKVYQRTVGDTDWTGGELPNGEKAVTITGNGSYQWGVVTESGKVYQRQVGTTATEYEWNSSQFPDGEKAVAITGVGYPFTYWGVVTNNGKVYNTKIEIDPSVQIWSGGSLPNNEKAIIITGDGYPYSYFGVVTKSGAVYQRQTDIDSWAGGTLPAGRKAVAITGGYLSNYWGIIADNGKVYQIVVSGLPSKEEAEFDRNILSFNTVSAFSETANISNNSFIDRKYKLPVLEPGEELQVKVTAKVNKKSYEEDPVGEGIVVGNQAWTTFKEVTRTAPTVTPDLPTWTSADGGTKYGQWTGNTTCTATDDWVTPGDQCGQVYTEISTTDELLGSLSGIAFYDADRDGYYNADKGDMLVPNVTVYLMQGDENKGQTVTDDNGYYIFKNLTPSNNYEVSFSVTSIPGITGSNVGWDYTTQNVNPEGDRPPTCVVGASCSNSYGVTPGDIAVVAENETTDVNVGVVSITPKIIVDNEVCSVGDSCDKWGEEDWVSALTGEANTTYTTRALISNNGDEPLKNLTFSDSVENGENIKWTSYYTEGSDTPASLTGEWVNGKYVYSFPDNFVLSTGDKVVVIGEVVTPQWVENSEWLQKSNVEVTGVGSITLIKVSDKSTVQINVGEKKEPVPSITIEKGILVKDAVSDDDCADGQVFADNGCWIKNTVIDNSNKEREITFRITNNGEESIEQIVVNDKTIKGVDSIDSIACDWGDNNRTLDVGETIDCRGTLNITRFPSEHENKVTVVGLGSISGKFATDNSEFESYNAYTPDFPAVGSGGWLLWFIVSGVLVVAGVSYGIYSARNKK